MEYIHSVSELELSKATAVTLGKFDGVHIGHQKLMAIVKQKAAVNNLLSVVFTFENIPLAICPQKQQRFITTNSERRAFMEQLGMDIEIEYPFTQELMNTSPADFVKNILVDMLRAKVVVVGPDYHFGKGRMGTPDILAQLGEQYGFETIIVEKEKYQDKEVSSTFTREELEEGHMETVNVLLGRPYAISGVVYPERQLGRTIGFPTMNIYPKQSKLLPPKGVYASKTVIDGKEYYSITNLGTKPTVSSQHEIGVETHVFDYDGDAYGKHIEVKLIHFIRPEMKFENTDSLKKQIDVDVNFAKEMFLLNCIK